MGSSYYSPGEQEQKNALANMLIHAKNMKEQGKNFWGKELKVDPSKGKGTVAQANVVNAKRMPVGGAMGRGLAHQKVAKDLANPAIKTAQEVGTTGLQQKFAGLLERGSAEKLGMSFGSTSSAPLSIAPEVTTAAQQQIAQTASQVGQNVASTTANALKVGSEVAKSSATTLQSAASSALPYLLAAQLAFSIGGARGDDPGKLAGGSGKHKEEELLPGLVG